jgi:hypothetical protein
MTKPRDPEALLSAYLADGIQILPDRVVDSVLDEVHRTRQRAVFGPWRTRSLFRAALGTAAVVALLALGGALLIQRDRDEVATPSPTPQASDSPRQPAVVTATPTPTPEVPSLDLVWTELDLEANLQSGFGTVAWLNDQFVLLEDSGAIRTSTDGATWSVLQPGDPDPGYLDLLWGKARFVCWEDEIVGWWNPEDGPSIAGKPPITARDILRIVSPPAAPIDTTPFKGRIESIGIGPAGIVAQVHSHIDTDEWIASRLGENWVSHYTGVDLRDGILDVGMDNGPGLHVVWADEGFEPGDYFDNGFGWYSPDGEQWTAIPYVGTPGSDEFRGIPTGFGDVVGVSDGFIARGIDTECASDNGCAGMWYSADGLTWQNIGSVPNGPNESNGSMVPWMGGALVSDGVGRFVLWTSDGPTELPMVAELPDEWTQSDPNDASSGMGPLGLATVLKEGQQILVTWDGVVWDIEPMPAAMAAGSTLFYGAPNVIVGDRSVLVVVWSGSQEARIPTFWVGTPRP